MTTPPSKLLDALIPGSVYTLRSADAEPLGQINYRDAMRMARLGIIEGVGGKAGSFRCLRRLNESAIEESAEEHAAHPEKAFLQRAHSLNAITNLGAYQQEVSTGKVWALKMCKWLDGATA